MEVSNLRDPLNLSQEESEGHEFDEQILYSSKVYGILTLIYLFIFYVCGVIISVPLLGEYISQSYVTVAICLFQNFLIITFAFFSKDYARIFPTNYLMLILYTFNNTFMLAVVCVYFTEILYCGLLSFLAVTLALMIYTRFSVFSEYYLGTAIKLMIFWGILLMSIFIVVRGFGDYYESFYLPFIAMIYGIWLLIDTHVIQPSGNYFLTSDDVAIGVLRTKIDLIYFLCKLLSCQYCRSSEA